MSALKKLTQAAVMGLVAVSMIACGKTEENKANDTKNTINGNVDEANKINRQLMKEGFYVGYSSPEDFTTTELTSIESRVVKIKELLEGALASYDKDGKNVFWYGKQSAQDVLQKSLNSLKQIRSFRAAQAADNAEAPVSEKSNTEPVQTDAI